MLGDRIRQLNRAKILNEASVFHCLLDRFAEEDNSARCVAVIELVGPKADDFDPRSRFHPPKEPFRRIRVWAQQPHCLQEPRVSRIDSHKLG